MATIKTKFMVGVFVVAGFTLAAIAVIWLGMSNYLEKGKYYTAYFDESVQGLEKDSPVKYRGVAIGSVHQIGVTPDADFIQLVLKIETDIELDESIVAQLKSVGITGIMFVELDKLDDDEALVSPKLQYQTKYPVINTKPSDIKKFFEDVNEVLAEFKKLDLEGISGRLKSVLATMEETIDDVQIASLIHDLRTTLERIQTIADNEKWNTLLSAIDLALIDIRSLSKDGRRTLSSLDTTLGLVDKTFLDNEKGLADLIYEMRSSIEQINLLVNKSRLFIEDTQTETARFMPQLRKTLGQYEKAAKNLERFLEQITDHPSQLILGAPDRAPNVEMNSRNDK